MGGGGWTIGVNVGRWQRAYRPGQGIVCPYQYGAIGPDLAMMIGASAAVQRGVGPQAPYKGAPTVCVSSDAGIAYSLFELDTAAKYKLPVIGSHLQQRLLGHVAQCRVVGALDAPVSLPAKPAVRPDGRGVGRPRRIRPHARGIARGSASRSYQAATKESLSTLINCQGMKEFTSARKYPPGVALNPEPGCGAVAH